MLVGRCICSTDSVVDECVEKDSDTIRIETATNHSIKARKASLKQLGKEKKRRVSSLPELFRYWVPECQLSSPGSPAGWEYFLPGIEGTVSGVVAGLA